MTALTQADYQRAALIIGCEPAVIRAVAQVEAAGDGFLKDGRPKILFEAHIFSRLTQHRFDLEHSTISSRVWNAALYRGGEREHDRLAKAIALDRVAALQSASWGKFQIMGFNFRRCGFASVEAFVEAMKKSEGEHLTAFCHFVQSMGLADELQRRDWPGFARAYNGPQYALNRYDAKLEQAYDLFSAIDRGHRVRV